MRHLDVPTLTSDHVTLVPLALEHVAPLLAAANVGRSNYQFALVPADEPSMRAYVEAALAETAQGAAVPFAVLGADGQVVGCTRYLSIEWWSFPGPPPEPVPRGPDALEIGFTWYAENAQRTAVNTASKLLLCTHAFERWGVRRITWKTDARNARSRAAILRLGATFDGVLRAHRPATDGIVRDTAFFSMLNGEWPAAKGALERRLGAALG